MMNNLYMPIENAIEMVKNMIHEPVSEAELYCAEMYYGSGNLVFQDPEDYALNTALRELEKAEKYAWHDLRKNPNDLPKEGKPFLYAFTSKNGVYNDVLYNTSMGYFPDIECIKNQSNEFVEYIAWREIEPFEEEE